jgi:hypothetical protein
MEDQYGWIKWIWSAIFIPVFAHIYRKMDKAVDRDEYNGTINSLRDEIKNGNEAITERIDRLMTIMIEKK